MKVTRQPVSATLPTETRPLDRPTTTSPRADGPARPGDAFEAGKASGPKFVTDVVGGMLMDGTKRNVTLADPPVLALDETMRSATTKFSIPLADLFEDPQAALSLAAHGELGQAILMEPWSNSGRATATARVVGSGADAKVEFEMQNLNPAALCKIKPNVMLQLPNGLWANFELAGPKLRADYAAPERLITRSLLENHQGAVAHTKQSLAEARADLADPSRIASVTQSQADAAGFRAELAEIDGALPARHAQLEALLAKQTPAELALVASMVGSWHDPGLDELAGAAKALMAAVQAQKQGGSAADVQAAEARVRSLAARPELHDAFLSRAEPYLTHTGAFTWGQPGSLSGLQQRKSSTERLLAQFEARAVDTREQAVKGLEGYVSLLGEELVKWQGLVAADEKRLAEIAAHGVVRDVPTDY